MRANPFSNGLLWRVAVPVTRPVLTGISITLVLGGCATHPPLGVSSGNVQPLPEPLRLQLTSVTLAEPYPAAQVSFDPPLGQTGTFGEAATTAAGRTLDPSGVVKDPGAQAIVGTAGFLAAPVVAVVAGRSTARQRLGAEQLSFCQSNLVAAMKSMAAQERFQDFLVKAASVNTRRQLLRPQTNAPAGANPAAEAVLETQVQHLRLERTGKDDTSYALHIQAQARLLRVADHSVLYETPLTWRSGTCMFMDWTLSGSFQKVTQTAYREMAERLVNQLFVATPEGPVLAGAGYPQAIARRTRTTQVAAVNRPLLGLPGLQPVWYPPKNTGTIGIYPTRELPGVTVQRPSTRDMAASEAVEEMNWTFDRLYNHPNPMVAAPSIAAGIPLGLWKQGAAVVFGLSERRYRQADARLTAAIRETHPQEGVAWEVAQALTEQTRQNIVLLPPAPPGVDSEMALQQCIARATPARVPHGQFVAEGPRTSPPDTVLEIHVVHTTLEAKGGINPPLALCVEVQARLRRASDGAEIYACPVRYRSRERKFTQWADHDARLFRQEMQACYREVGAAVVAQLAARNLVRPGAGRGSVVAGN